MQVVREPDVASMRAKVANPVRAEFTEKHGSELLDRIDDALAR